MIKGIGLTAWLAATLLLPLATAPSRLRAARAAWWGLFQLLFVKSLFDIAIAGGAFGFQIFRPGNDYLVYETFARAILSGDILSRIEGPLVHLNFAYRYVLAALHLAAGEAPADVMVLEQAVTALIIVLVGARVARFYGARAGIATAVVAVGAHQLARLEPPLLDTPWSVGVSAVALFALIDYPRRPSTRTAAVIGLSLGMAGLLRANLIPLVAAAVVWMAVAGGRRFPDAVRRHVGVVVVLSMGVLALLPIRNLIVAGDARWLPENGLVNLWIGNHPPEFDGPTYFIVKSAPPREEIAKRVLEYCPGRTGRAGAADAAEGAVRARHRHPSRLPCRRRGAAALDSRGRGHPRHSGDDAPQWTVGRCGCCGRGSFSSTPRSSRSSPGATAGACRRRPSSRSTSSAEWRSGPGWIDAAHLLRSAARLRPRGRPIARRDPVPLCRAVVDIRARYSFLSATNGSTAAARRAGT